MIKKRPKNYWNDTTIIENLKEIIKEKGYFPLYDELALMKERGSITNAVDIHGGLNKFRNLLGYSIHKHNGYWTKEKLLNELKPICEKLGYFPSRNELLFTNNYVLINAINRNGGTIKIRELLGFKPSLWETYNSSMRSYTSKRGKNSEKIIKNILKEWCKLYNFSEPTYNVKLSKGRIIEFVCNTNKTIGIDITNFRCSKRCIKEKWSKREYHKYLDELWIIVFTEKLTKEDYIKINKNAPSNVKVMSVYEFLKELDYSLSENIKSKIDKYNKCTFHTKEEFKKEYFESIKAPSI